MDDLWNQVRACFDTDDGSLPEIAIGQLSAAGVAAVYAMLRARSRIVGGPPEFWSLTAAAARPIDSVPNAALLVTTGEAEVFHFCLDGLVARGVELPTLGVFVFQDSIELDYRMGPGWGRDEVAGFFDLLRDCSALDPGAVVASGLDSPPFPERFERAWSFFLAGCP